MPGFEFIPESANATPGPTVSSVIAVILLRKATGKTLTWAKLNVEHNLGVKNEYAAHDIGELIREYWST